MANIAYQRLVGYLKQLRLSGITDCLDEAISLATKQKLPYLEFLDGLLGEEVQRRDEGALQRKMKQASFPVNKTLDSFDFNFQPSLDKQVVMNLANLSFVDRREVAVFIGPPGVGKTHLSISLGIAACQEGYRVLFRTARQLIRQLRTTQADDSLDTLLRKWNRIDLLILDELGYMVMDKNDASLLFQLIAHRYERGAIIVTTNVVFSDWDKWLNDPVIATAILDRLLHHATIIPINGESYRIRRKNLKDDYTAGGMK
jgi:DNA replication protein DnaC